MAHGYFITVETSCPPCRTEPPYPSIRKKYGEPDFVLSSKEEEKVRKHTGTERDEDPENLITYYYDYFGFQVSAEDEEEKVVGVLTQANDFSAIRPIDKGAYYTTIGMKNLTVFHANNQEVGRIYYFMEGAKKPLCIQEPPKGTYTSSNETLEYAGNGEWNWTGYYRDGKKARTATYKNHQKNGTNIGYFPNGKISFSAPYKNGLLDGEVIQYSEDGNETKSIMYKEGEEVPQEKS